MTSEPSIDDLKITEGKFLSALKHINEAEDIINEIDDKNIPRYLINEFENLKDQIETARADAEHIKKEWRNSL